MAKSKERIAGQIAWDDKGAYVRVTTDFASLPRSEQWIIMRATQRAMDKIVSKLTDEIQTNNRQGKRQ